MNRFFVVVFLSLFSVICYAQGDVNEFSSDRPGMTTGPDVMSKNKLIWEVGLAFENDCIDEIGVKTLNYHNSLFRYGLSNYAEVRFGFATNETYTRNAERYGGISSLFVGTKMKLLDESKIFPKVSFLGELLLPGSINSNYLPQHIGANLHLVFNNEITSWFSLGYDAGVVWSGMQDEEHASTILGLNLNFKPSERFSLYVEECNTLNKENLYFTELGATYMVSSRVQVDAYADIDLQHINKYINLGLGLSWLIL